MTNERAESVGSADAQKGPLLTPESSPPSGYLSQVLLEMRFRAHQLLVFHFTALGLLVYFAETRGEPFAAAVFYLAAPAASLPLLMSWMNEVTRVTSALRLGDDVEKSNRTKDLVGQEIEGWSRLSSFVLVAYIGLPIVAVGAALVDLHNMRDEHVPLPLNVGTVRILFGAIYGIFLVLLVGLSLSERRKLRQTSKRDVIGSKTASA